jgi:arylsulfatase
MPRRLFGPSSLGLALALVACGREPSPPQWIDLARGFHPRALAELAASLEAKLPAPRAGRTSARPGASGGSEELWFELPLPPASWKEETSGIWLAPIPSGGALLAADPASLELLRGENALERIPRAALKPGQYFVGDTEVRLALEPGTSPPEDLVCRQRLENGREVDGAWRVAQGDLGCNGLLVFPGAPERLRCALPAASRLGFATVSPDPGGHGAELGATTFRVKLGARTLFEERQEYRTPLRSAWHWITLEESDAPVELSFEVDGEAPALFATPTLAPRDAPAAGASRAHPDLVLVLCDTFRADNLAAWGGAPELAPHLNRWIETTRRYLETRSAAAWTLPSIGSILTGVFPAQHGGTDMDRGILDSVETVAEILARAGYRTAAVTDGGLFSRHYGQDQGFQWFEEISVPDWSLKGTLERARARMAADDGRPLFLVVHTYRVHGPMRLGPDEDPVPWRKLRKTFRERLEERRKAGEVVKVMDFALEYVDEGRRFYEDAVRDLDAKVGGWIEELERDGFFARGRLVLTADHGDAFGEHGQVGHGSDLFDVKLRVPLALAGFGIETGPVAGPVSLIDLAPTMAELAGVAPSPAWAGHSLLGRTPSGPLFAFDLKEKEPRIALYSEGKKLMAPDVAALRAGRPTHAFDLVHDPKEEHDLAQESQWPGELGRAFAAWIEPLTEPARDAKLLELSPELKAQLEAIGYGGD